MDKIYSRGIGPSHIGTKPRREIPIPHSQSTIRNLDRMNKIIRMATGCARCSAWQISHLVSLQASLRAAGCLIASSAARMTLSADLEGRSNSRNLSRRIPTCRNKQAKNITSASSLGRVLLFYASPNRVAKACVLNPGKSCHPV
jgi:hypothetical protein